VKRLALLVPSVVLVLAGCSGSGESAKVGEPAGPSLSADAQSGSARDAPSAELQRFYDQEIDWQPCEDGNECAQIEVPLDYDDPTGESIELNLLKNPAEGDRGGNLVVNPGGPGAPGTDYADNADDEESPMFTQVVRDRFDIIGFDPRGTGESAPLDCLTDTQLDAFIAGDPDPDTPAEVKQYVGWYRTMGQGCAEKSGEVAAHISTYEAARDMDTLRAALGDEKLTYFGASYGTKLGATYADLFPERSGRFVLDGAVDVSLSTRDSSLQQAHGFEVALTAYVDDCIARGECYLGSTRAQALRRIKGFLASVEAEPMTVGDRELAIGNAFYGIAVTLYDKEYWPYLTVGLGNALKGDGEILLLLADAYSSREDDGTYSDNSSEAIYEINCLDDPSLVPAAQIPRQFRAFEKASPTFGRVFAWGLVSCSGLAVDPPDFDWDLDAAGADRLLVIGTTRDPATPLRWAQALAAQLDPAVLVTRDGDGHTGFNQGNTCVDDVVQDYLIDGVVPDADVDCPAP